MKYPLLAALGIALTTTIVHAADHSATLTAGQVTIVLPASTGLRSYERVINVGLSGVAWCSRFDAMPAPNKAGSFPLAPYGNSLGLPSAEEFTSANGYVPQLALFCTADTGNATLTGEVAP